MAQSKKQSVVESVVNTTIGFAVNYIANLIILPLFGYHVTLRGNLVMGLIYTAISVVRSYVIRRFFNKFRGE